MMFIRCLYIVKMIFEWTRSDSFRKLLRFALVGFFCAVVHFGLFGLLHEVIGVHYQIANAVGFLVAFVFNFGLNKRLTFGIKGWPSLRESIGFSGKKVLFYLLSAGMLHMLVEYAGLSPWQAQVVLIPAFGVLGFLFLKKFVFIH